MPTAPIPSASLLLIDCVWPVSLMFIPFARCLKSEALVLLVDLYLQATQAGTIKFEWVRVGSNGHGPFFLSGVHGQQAVFGMGCRILEGVSTRQIRSEPIRIPEEPEVIRYVLRGTHPGRRSGSGPGIFMRGKSAVRTVPDGFIPGWHHR